MNEIIHGYVVSVILTKFRINANIQLWQSFSILNFEIGIVSDFLQYINPWLFGLVKECEYTYYLLTVYTAALCFNGFLASYQLRFVWKISPLLDHKMCDS